MTVLISFDSEVEVRRGGHSRCVMQCCSRVDRFGVVYQYWDVSVWAQFHLLPNVLGTAATIDTMVKGYLVTVN
ncbi:unnamed protein product [Gongylonema pulchrum]|uniref:Uncharacterized protein n=1 Tax=Gongylonema pulchrum TaxID=637853 RepID=A0A183DND1_9BILA|nr:unnamed protein product [Gongylonema pulchrum]